MSKRGIIQKAERFEVHHRILVFAGILILVVLGIRVGVHFYDPHPKLFGMDLHHFDFGLLLLLVSSQISLFGPKKYHYVYFLMTAVATALILDQYWLVRRGPDPAGATPTDIYNISLISAAALVTGCLLTMLFVHAIIAKRRRK